MKISYIKEGVFGKYTERKEQTPEDRIVSGKKLAADVIIKKAIDWLYSIVPKIVYDATPTQPCLGQFAIIPCDKTDYNNSVLKPEKRNAYTHGSVNNILIRYFKNVIQLLIPVSPIHESIGIGSVQVDNISKFDEIVSTIKSEIINKSQDEGEDIAAVCKAVNIENIDIKFYFDNTQYVYFSKGVKKPYHVDHIGFLEGFAVDEYLNYWNSNLDYI